MAVTAQQLIDSTLRLIGVLDAGESPSTNESNHAFEVLNQMLGSWSAAGLPIPSLSFETIATTGVASYTLATRPMQIKAVQSVSAGVAQDVQPAYAEEWATIRDTTLTGKFATRYLYDAGYPAASIKVHPIPATGGSLVLHTLLPLTQLASLSTPIALPPGYEHALRFALASALAPEYGSVLSPEVASNAAEAKTALAQLHASTLGPPGASTGKAAAPAAAQ